MPLDAAALARALELVRHARGDDDALPEGARRVRRNARGGDVVVACTQEARLFGDVAEEGGKTQTIRFVNIRETGGWSAEASAATPKIAALLALAALPEPEPVPRVTYRSEGRLLIVGPAEPRCTGRSRCSRRISRSRVLVTGRATGAELPAERDFPDLLGQADAGSPAGSARSTRRGRRKIRSISICARAATRASARVPSTRSTLRYQIDLDRCKRASQVRRRVRRDGGDRLRPARTRARRSASTSCSICSVTPHFRMHQPPQGYFAPGSEPVAQAQAVAELALYAGEFEKPKYFAYKPSICAHSRVAEAGLQPVHRRLLDRGDHAPTATTSRSSRTCAWAAARARRCVRRAR